MKVSIERFDVPMDVKQNGVEFRVSANGKQVGDLVVTKSYVIWCQGRIRPDNGKKVRWNRFIELMNSYRPPGRAAKPAKPAK